MTGVQTCALPIFGTEPHDYEPSAKAVATIQDADAFVYENEKYGDLGSWTVKNFEK